MQLLWPLFVTVGLNHRIRLFHDDFGGGGGENSPSGKVSSVKIWNGVVNLSSFCNTPLAPTNNTPAVNLNICANSNATLSASSSGPINWFATTTSTTVLTSGTTLITPTLSPGTYTYYASTTNTCTESPRSPIVVNVNVNPLVSINSGSICNGQSFTLSALGATSYTYSSGTTIVSPISNTSYTVTGANALGCTNTAVSNVTVNAIPTLAVNSGSICAGNPFTMSATGANTYTYSSGSKRC